MATILKRGEFDESTSNTFWEKQIDERTLLKALGLRDTIRLSGNEIEVQEDREGHVTVVLVLEEHKPVTE